MVAWLDVVHVAADLLNNARALMPQHHGQLARIAAIEKMHVTMADAGSLCTNKHLSWAGFGDRNFLNLHRHIHFAKYCCFHGNSPSPEFAFECAIAAWAREYAMGHVALILCWVKEDSARRRMLHWRSLQHRDN